MQINAVFLKFMFESTLQQRKAVLTQITKQHVEVLSEIALNIYKGVFPNKTSYVKPLKPYKTVIFELGSKSESIRRKKNCCSDTVKSYH